MTHPRPFRFGVMAANARSSVEWIETAKKAEGLGYSTLVMPDHFAGQLAPIAALTVAATVTETLRVGTLMFATGIAHDRPRVPINRMIEAIAVLRGLWAGEPFSYSGDHCSITEMGGTPMPVQSGGPPIAIGGGGQRVLSTAARVADIVGVNPNVSEGKFGAGAIASMSAEEAERKLGWVRGAAGDRFDDIEISMLKFVTTVTDDRDAVAAKVGACMGMDAAAILASPHTRVGPAEQIVDELREQRDRWQGSYVTVQSNAIDSFAPVVAALSGT